MIPEPRREHFKTAQGYFDAMVSYHRKCHEKAVADSEQIDKANGKLFSNTRLKAEAAKIVSNSPRARNRETLQDILENRPALLKAYKQGILFKL